MRDALRILALGSALLAHAACGPAPETKKEEKTEAQAAPAATPVAIVPAKTEAPAGTYKLDKAHANLEFRVNHIGFSNYTARFTTFDAELQFDPANPAASTVTATIDPRSLALPTPPAGFLDTLLSEKWLGAAAFPQMTFRSTKIELTGANTARITGDLTLKGATAPVVLDATFNGGYAGHPYDPQARIGFSAKGSLKRTAFGVSEGVPPPGSTMGVSDDVEIIVETEFNGPPLPKADAPMKPQ
jgi:polyisoprenoid-binding protein YceI